MADSGLDGAMDVLRTIAVTITAILFLLAGLTQLMGSVIIPAAAKELEKECLELNPSLWEEYQAKLEPNQTMADRPDLMQEIGQKLQPLLDAKIAQFEGGEEAWLAQDIPSRSAATKSGSMSESAQEVMEVENDDDDDDDWSSNPSLDLSVLTDQIPLPSKSANDDDTKA